MSHLYFDLGMYNCAVLGRENSQRSQNGDWWKKVTHYFADTVLFLLFFSRLFLLSQPGAVLAVTPLVMEVEVAEIGYTCESFVFSA